MNDLSYRNSRRVSVSGWTVLWPVLIVTFELLTFSIYYGTFSVQFTRVHVPLVCMYRVWISVEINMVRIRIFMSLSLIYLLNCLHYMQASTHFPVLTVSLSVDSFCGDDEVSWVRFSASGVASSATASVRWSEDPGTSGVLSKTRHNRHIAVANKKNWWMLKEIDGC